MSDTIIQATGLEPRAALASGGEASVDDLHGGRASEAEHYERVRSAVASLTNPQPRATFWTSSAATALLMATVVVVVLSLGWIVSGPVV